MITVNDPSAGTSHWLANLEPQELFDRSRHAARAGRVKSRTSKALGWVIHRAVALRRPRGKHTMGDADTRLDHPAFLDTEASWTLR